MTLSISKLLTLIMLLMLPLYAWSQDDENDDGSDFVDPNQYAIDSLLSLIHEDSPDSVKATKYKQMAELTFNYPLKLEYAKKSLEFCDSTDLAVMAFDYSYIGCAYYMLDEPSKALAPYYKSAKLFSAIADSSAEANQYINIGSCFEDLNIQDSIFYYYNKALKIFIDINKPSLISYSYQRLALIYTNLNFFETAIDNYKQALRYAMDAHDMLEIASCYLGMGELMSLKEDSLSYSQSIEYLKKSIKLFDSTPTQDIYYISNKYDSYSVLATSYINMAKITGQKKYADSCYMYIKEIGDFFLTQGNYQTHVITM
nr:hypothetical protein [Bacteroidales bacterium]